MIKMDAHRLHRLMFYNLEPKAINCMSYNENNNLLAVLRSDNRIEIWDMRAAPYIQSTVLLKPQTKLKGIVWCDKKIFGADLEGFIKELSLRTLREENSYPVVSGGPCHCIAINKSNTLLAVGTELGFINVFNIEEDETLSLLKLIQSDKKRILSIGWHISGDYLVTCGADVIKLYYHDNLVHNMKPAKLHKKRNLIVWSVVVTDDLTIIAGDSSGTLSIWDGKKGICTESIKSHSSDILTVCLSHNQQSVFCAGIDPDIKIFDRTKMSKLIKWIKSRDIKNHTHDVNSIVQLNDGRLCSGGVDSYLSISNIMPYTVQLYPPLYQNPSVYISVQSRCILLRYSGHLELWHLRNISPDVVCSEPFVKLVELRSVNNELIRSAAISNDGKFIAYATNKTTRTFSFSLDDDKPNLQPLSLTDCKLTSVYNILFCDSSKLIIISDNESLVQVFSTSCENMLEMPLQYSIHLSDNSRWADNTISLLTSSYNGDYVAVSGSNMLIGVWNKSKFLVFLPKYRLPATAIAFHPQENILYAVYSDFTFIEFSLDKLHYTSFSKSFDSSILEKYLGCKGLPVTNIGFDFNKNSIIMLNTSSTICVFDKNKVVKVDHMKKKIKLDPDSDKSPLKRRNKGNTFKNQSNSSTINLKSYFEKNINAASEKDLSEDTGFHVYEKYQHLVHFGSFSSKEVIAIEIKPQKFLEKLPPLLKKKQYGKK